jgi:hypothetical protein
MDDHRIEHLARSHGVSGYLWFILHGIDYSNFPDRFIEAIIDFSKALWEIIKVLLFIITSPLWFIPLSIARYTNRRNWARERIKGRANNE